MTSTTTTIALASARATLAMATFAAAAHPHACVKCRGGDVGACRDRMYLAQRKRDLTERVDLLEA